MTTNKKIIVFTLITVPVLIGGYFLYKYLKPKDDSGSNLKGEEENNDESQNVNTNTNTQTSNQTSTQTNQVKSGFPLRKGSKGEDVKSVQRALNIVADGIFGSQTDLAVRNFQKSKNIVVDGIVGNNTWKLLFFADYPSLGDGYE
jgi:murein L,D-transpeptidase YcbB/YkuD